MNVMLKVGGSANTVDIQRQYNLGLSCEEKRSFYESNLSQLLELALTQKVELKWNIWKVKCKIE